jgi:pimeloyl-ACP methyl ester carboxylesterase
MSPTCSSLGPGSPAAPPVTIRSRDIEASGMRSRVVEAGKPSAREAVVFVHGVPGSSEDWGGLVGRVGAFARAVAVDMPGFGRSERPPPHRFDYTVDAYARHLDRVLSEVRIDRAHLVLHDFGGLWGLTWAAHRHDRLASLVLVNSGILLGFRWPRLARLFRTPLVGELMMASVRSSDADAFAQHLAVERSRPLPRSFTDRVFRELDRGTARAILRIYRTTRDVDGLGRCLWAALAPLSRPTLVVWGRHDPYIPVEQSARQRETFPDAELSVLDDSAHWPMADDPGALEACVVPFLQRVIAARGPRG